MEPQVSGAVAAAILSSLGAVIVFVLTAVFIAGKYQNTVDELKDDVRKARLDIENIKIFLAAKTGQTHL